MFSKRIKSIFSTEPFSIEYTVCMWKYESYRFRGHASKFDMKLKINGLYTIMLSHRCTIAHIYIYVCIYKWCYVSKLNGRCNSWMLIIHGCAPNWRINWISRRARSAAFVCRMKWLIFLTANVPPLITSLAAITTPWVPLPTTLT